MAAPGSIAVIARSPIIRIMQDLATRDTFTDAKVVAAAAPSTCTGVYGKWAVRGGADGERETHAVVVVPVRTTEALTDRELREYHALATLHESELVLGLHDWDGTTIYVFADEGLPKASDVPGQSKPL